LGITAFANADGRGVSLYESEFALFAWLQSSASGGEDISLVEIKRHHHPLLPHARCDDVGRTHEAALASRFRATLGHSWAALIALFACCLRD
jgi:hypothetical protein